MKKSTGKSGKQTKKKAPAAKSGSKATAGKQAARPTAPPKPTTSKSVSTSPAVEHWTPREIQGMGWKPFRYPPE
jgi:hypothetical protein